MHQPAMLHRAVLGSLERFMAIYIEHTGGDFPFWLSPVQVGILPITERHIAHGKRVHERLCDAGVRSQLDERSETLGFKIREAEIQKIPLTLVIGDQEDENGTAMPRLRKSKEKFEALAVDELVTQLAEATTQRRVAPFEN